jgi:2-polyprenyl-3-methyl-5-hydroxy-6-metoxy-1,4-benzoquinol methylase
MTTIRDENAIRSYSRPTCCLCGALGTLLYQDLRDSLFSASGEWSFKKCSNPACRLIWLDPMPLEEDIGKAYGSYYTHRDSASPRGNNNLLRRGYRFVKQGYLSRKFGYGTGISSWQQLLGTLLYLHPFRRENLDLSVMCLPARQDGFLLDIGSGSGEMLKRMQKLGWRVEGVEFDPQACMLARSKGLTVNLGTLAAQNYPDDHFDAIVMHHLIEHVHDPVALFKECHRILKPGGRIVVMTPNSESLLHKRFLSNWRGLEPPRHLYLFSLGSIALAVEKSGLAMKSLRTTGRSANWMYLASRAIQLDSTETLPYSAKLLGYCYLLIEAVLAKFKLSAGEELLVTAEKARL